MPPTRRPASDTRTPQEKYDAMCQRFDRTIARGKTGYANRFHRKARHVFHMAQSRIDSVRRVRTHIKSYYDRQAPVTGYQQAYDDFVEFLKQEIRTVQGRHEKQRRRSGNESRLVKLYYEVLQAGGVTESLAEILQADAGADAATGDDVASSSSSASSTADSHVGRHEPRGAGRLPTKFTTSTSSSSSSTTTTSTSTSTSDTDDSDSDAAPAAAAAPPAEPASIPTISVDEARRLFSAIHNGTQALAFLDDQDIPEPFYSEGVLTLVLKYPEADLIKARYHIILKAYRAAPRESVAKRAFRAAAQHNEAIREMVELEDRIVWRATYTPGVGEDSIQGLAHCADFNTYFKANYSDCGPLAQTVKDLPRGVAHLKGQPHVPDQVLVSGGKEEQLVQPLRDLAREATGYIGLDGEQVANWLATNLNQQFVLSLIPMVRAGGAFDQQMLCGSAQRLSVEEDAHFAASGSPGDNDPGAVFVDGSIDPATGKVVVTAHYDLLHLTEGMNARAYLDANGVFKLVSIDECPERYHHPLMTLKQTVRLDVEEGDDGHRIVVPQILQVVVESYTEALAPPSLESGANDQLEVERNSNLLAQEALACSDLTSSTPLVLGQQAYGKGLKVPAEPLEHEPQAKALRDHNQTKLALAKEFLAALELDDVREEEAGYPVLDLGALQEKIREIYPRFHERLDALRQQGTHFQQPDILAAMAQEQHRSAVQFRYWNGETIGFANGQVEPSRAAGYDRYRSIFELTSTDRQHKATLDGLMQLADLVIQWVCPEYIPGLPSDLAPATTVADMLYGAAAAAQTLVGHAQADQTSAAQQLAWRMNLRQLSTQIKQLDTSVRKHPFFDPRLAASRLGLPAVGVAAARSAPPADSNSDGEDTGHRMDPALTRAALDPTDGHLPQP